jgi:uncharacterized damage-inducible protein DinB
MEIRDPAAFTAYFDNIRKRTLRVARCIPPEQIEWRPRDGAFSFGDLLRHIAAMERWMFAENVAQRPSRYAGCGPELAAGSDAIFAFVDRMHAEAMAIFGSLGPDDLDRRCEPPGGASMPTWKWLRAMVEHEVHHRGQIYLMLGVIGVATPPLYGLTAEQVESFSVK